ncbi:MAG: ELWxxDGT repeat protein [Bacteroidota bacterium]
MKLLSLILLTLLTTAVLAQEAVVLNDFSTRGVGTFRLDPEIEGIVMKPTPGVDAAEGLLFVADNGKHGEELWYSNGTELGTQVLIDIEAGGGLINANSTLFFTATDDEHGQELWRTDGTPEGTQLVQDIFAGPGDGSPTLLDYINEILFFIACDESNGRKLWALSPLRIQTELSTSSSAVCSTEDSITFTISATDARAEPTYQWYVNDQLIPDQNGSAYTAAGFSDGNEVRVQVVASKDVWVLNDSVFSETITVDFSALAPKITVAGNSLTVSEGTTYRWFLDSDALPDTTQSIIAEEAGCYQVEITAASGCVARSEEVEVEATVTSLADEQLARELRIYPNPATSSLTIDSQRRGKILLEIFNR